MDTVTKVRVAEPLNSKGICHYVHQWAPLKLFQKLFRKVFQWSLAASGHVFARSPENSQLAGKWQVLVRHVINNDIYGVLKRFDKYFGIWIMEFTVFESGLEANGR